MNWRYDRSPERQNTAVAHPRVEPAITTSQSIAADKDQPGARHSHTAAPGAGHRLANISIAAPLVAAATRPAFQAKLTVSQPDDPYEQEADSVADQVMRMPDPAKAGSSIVPAPVRDLSLQRQPTIPYSATSNSALDNVATALQQGGRPLDAATRVGKGSESILRLSEHCWTRRPLRLFVYRVCGTAANTALVSVQRSGLHQ